MEISFSVVSGNNYKLPHMHKEKILQSRKPITKVTCDVKSIAMRLVLSKTNILSILIRWFQHFGNEPKCPFNWEQREYSIKLSHNKWANNDTTRTLKRRSRWRIINAARDSHGIVPKGNENRARSWKQWHTLKRDKLNNYRAKTACMQSNNVYRDMQRRKERNKMYNAQA